MEVYNLIDQYQRYNFNIIVRTIQLQHHKFAISTNNFESGHLLVGIPYGMDRPGQAPNCQPTRREK